MSKQLQKLNDILDYLLTEQQVRLNMTTLRKIYEIDPDFDFSRFEFKKVPLTIMYRKFTMNRWGKTPLELKNLDFDQLNTNNCYEEKIYDMNGFKIGTDKIYQDVNTFIRNLSDVNCIIQNKIIDWQTKLKKDTTYEVKYLPSKENIKTIRYVLHSYTKKSHNMEKNSWRELSDYYINGNPIEYGLWLPYSREYKLNRIVKS